MGFEKGRKEGRKEGKGVLLNISPTMGLLLQDTLARSNTIAHNELNKDSLKKTPQTNTIDGKFTIMELVM